MTARIKFCAIAILAYLCNSIAAHTQELNLGMEDVDAYAQPALWKMGHDKEKPIVYRMVADSVVKHGGRYSMKLYSNSNRADFASCFLLIPLPVKGKTITIKGFLRTEDVKGAGVLFLSLANDSVFVAADNMLNSGKQMIGTKDWTELSITMPLSNNITRISFGALLVKSGILWVDDLVVMVDDKEIANAPVLQHEYRDPKTGRMQKF
jgi:hypothetical protein